MFLLFIDSVSRKMLINEIKCSDKNNLNGMKTKVESNNVVYIGLVYEVFIYFKLSLLLVTYNVHS